MDYFEIFELPPLLGLDPKDLERRFHELSRKHHPDFHARATGGNKSQSVEISARLNDAYRTLREKTRRAEYLVKSRGFKVDGSKLPQEMLMAVFEINEGLDDLRNARKTGGDIASELEQVQEFRDQIAAKRAAYEDTLDEAFRRWDELVSNDAPESEQTAHLEALADVISQSSYIRNLESELEGEVSH